MEMVGKMKSSELNSSRSRIASVHNGSSLSTGDAGGGDNIRHYIVENDLVEAIIQLPNNLFYNTGIATYIWILSNKKQNKEKVKFNLLKRVIYLESCVKILVKKLRICTRAY